MFRRKIIFKMGLVGLAMFAMASFVAAQAVSAADRVLLLQAKRFEGTYKLDGGETKLKVGDDSATWSVDSGSTKLSAALEPKAGKSDRATLNVDGRTVEGKATISGKVLTFTFNDKTTTYLITFSLSGRNEGDLSVMKNDSTLLAGAIKRL